MGTSELHYLGLRDVARLMRSGEVSPVELTRAMLDRIGDLDPGLHSFVAVSSESAMEAARVAEQEILRGDFRSQIHGVPLAIKDIFWTEGEPTAAGMAIHKDFVAGQDATVVKRLREAGAIILGKLTLTEGVYAEHRPPFHAPINPWNSEYWSAASSSGSAVAVASGLCFGALASETGGSIKLPSASSGVTGMKPTWGRVSRHGVFELAASLDHVGALARSAEDVAVMLGVMAGADELDPTSSNRSVPNYVRGLSYGVRGLRIGIDPIWTRDNVDRATSYALDGAMEVLVDQGAELVEVKLPDPTDMIWDWFGVCAVQTAVAHDATYPTRESEYGRALADLLKLGRAMSGMDYQRLLLRRADFRGRVDRVLQRVDVLAMPVLAFPAPTLERMTRMDDELIAGLHRFTCPFNMSGHPGVVMPCGFTTERMPIVYQLVGRHFSEDLLLTAAHAYQSATAWHAIHPLS